MSLEVFRRNQKILMAALTLMSMISFVFLDDTMKAGTTFLVPLILAALFGGGAFVWGTSRGKQNEYGAMGVVAGVVLGLVITTFGGRSAHEQLVVAGLSPQQVANLKSRRETANRLVAEIYKKSHPIPEQFLKAGPFGQQFYEMQLRRAVEQIQFTFGNEDFEKDVIFGDLLRREAERLGIRVSDVAVTDFIHMISDKKLGDEDFSEIKHALHVGDHFIYDLLREEIAARLAAEMTFPRAVATPEQRWEDFRKVNVKQSIEATTIPVEAFVKSIPDPTDSQLRDFFNEHAEKFPGPRGESGFRQPTCARLAYLEADYEAIEAKVTPPTDEEVAQYYEENKEFFMDRTPPKTEKKEDATEGDDAKKPDNDDSKKPEEKKDGEKKDGDKPDADKPDDSKKDDKPKADSKDSDKPKEEKPKEDKPKEDAKKDESKSDSDGANCDDEKTDEPKKEESKPADKADKKDAPKSDADKPEKKDEPKKEDSKDDSDKPKKEDAPKSDKPGEDEPKPDKPAEKSDEPEKKPELKYKPFDEVKEKIYDDLLRSRTLEEMKKRIESVLGKMRRLGSYTIAEKGSKSYRSPADVASELKELAKSLDLKYVETPLLSAEEFSKSEEYKIGGATDPTDAGVSRQGTVAVIQHVFGRGSDSTFTPEVAEDPGTKNRFAYWVIERLEAHVPKFEDDGIRQQVTKAWKLKQAAPKAEDRAKALAKQADGKALTEVLAGETVTGDKESQQLTVIESPGKFSHFMLQGASVPGVNPLMGGNERIELAQIPGLEKLGDDFFTAIDKLKPGETAAIPNFDRSAFVVVHVTEREEVDVAADAPQRGDFMKTWPHSPPANELASIGFNPLRREWMESIERKYNVKWPVK